MERQDSIFVRSAGIVGVAGVVAGVVGGLVGRALQAGKEPTAQERVRMAVADLTQHDAGSLKQSVTGTLRDATKTAKSDFKGATGKSKKQRKAAKKQEAALKASGMSFADYMRLALADGAERFGENFQEAFDQASGALSHYADELSDTSAKASKENRKKAEQSAKKAREELEAKAKEGRKELMKVQKNARGKTEDRLHVLEERARETLDKRVKPSLERAGASAAVAASETLKRLEEEAKDLEKRYAKAKPKLEKSADHYSERAGEVSKEVRHVAEGRAREAERAIQEAERALQQSAAHARHLAHDAGESAKSGSKNVGSLLFWLTVAGGIVYAVLLNDEQKRMMRELGQSAFHEGRAMYQDIRGENADFTA